MVKSTKARGAGAIIHYRPTDEFLFFLRDDKPSIPFPNTLDLIGGHVESGEEPLEAQIRELGEELVDLNNGRSYRPKGYIQFKQYIDARGVEQNVFALELDGKKPNLQTNEGQRLVWLSRKQIKESDFAFGFKKIILEYLEK